MASLPPQPSSNGGSLNDIFFGIVADESVLGEQVDRLEACFSELSNKKHLPDNSSASQEGSCWLTRLSVHTNEADHQESFWVGSTVQYTSDGGIVVTSANDAASSQPSSSARGSQEISPPRITIDKDNPNNPWRKDTHVLVLQTVQMIEGEMLHRVRKYAFGRNSIVDLEKKLVEQFQERPILPPEFAQEMTQMLRLSMAYWAQIEKEAESNGQPRCVEMAQLHQEALQKLLVSPVLKSMGVLIGEDVGVVQAPHDGIRDLVLPFTFGTLEVIVKKGRLLF